MHLSCNLESPVQTNRTHWTRLVNPDKVTQQIKKYIFYGLIPKDLIYAVGGGEWGQTEDPVGKGACCQPWLSALLSRPTARMVFPPTFTRNLWFLNKCIGFIFLRENVSKPTIYQTIQTVSIYLHIRWCKREGCGHSTPIILWPPGRKKRSPRPRGWPKRTVTSYLMAQEELWLSIHQITKDKDTWSWEPGPEFQPLPSILFDLSVPLFLYLQTEEPMTRDKFHTTLGWLPWSLSNQPTNQPTQKKKKNKERL